MQQNLTIAIVDTAYHTLATAAVTKAVEITKSNNVLVLSDRNFYPGSDFVEIPTIANKNEYSKIMLKELGKHIKTDHFIVIQYDGMPTNAEYWTDDFLKYDYIGAPWPWFPEGSNVGNGGFSLRSRKLSDLCLKDDFIIKENLVEDIAICHSNREWLEQQGIKYAPTNLARQFSVETPGGLHPSYGFHGTLCLPFYLEDDHLSAYIDNLTESMFLDPVHIRTMYGLFRAERYDHLEMYMDRATSIVPDFKQRALTQFPGDTVFFPGVTIDSLEQLLVNY